MHSRKASGADEFTSLLCTAYWDTMIDEFRMFLDELFSMKSENYKNNQLTDIGFDTLKCKVFPLLTISTDLFSVQCLGN
jgi:hypothetical protein